MNGTADMPTLLSRTDFESLGIETYGVTAEKRRVVVTYVGKRILDAVFNRRDCYPRIYAQQAYDNVFYWSEDVGLRSTDERDAILGALSRYWASLSGREVSPSSQHVWEQSIGGFSVRYVRHWHPHRFIVRTFCSVVVVGDKTPKRDGIVVDHETRHSVAYELPPNERPLPRDVVVGELLAQLKQKRKETVHD